MESDKDIYLNFFQCKLLGNDLERDEDAKLQSEGFLFLMRLTISKIVLSAETEKKNRVRTIKDETRFTSNSI